ncbi:unannotated protein [freshwater metagenome]|uniref:Unannotated protein n=1 Tax=freshwater metagenome TaxID=449393 RepID=A0A6J7E246_9ZZZZ
MAEPRPVVADYPGCPETVTAAVAQGRVLRSPRWGLWDVVGTLVSMVLLGGAASASLAMIGASVGAVVIVGSLAGWVGLAGWPMMATRLRGNGPRIDLGLSLSWREARLGVGVGLVALFAAAIVTAISAAVFGEFDSTAGDLAREMQGEGNRLAMIAFGLAIVVGAPIAEELAFRGLLFASLRKRGVGPVATVVLTAVAFSLFHFEPVRIAVLLTIGLILGAARARSGSLGVSIVAHAVNNAPGAIFVILGLQG